MVGGRASAVFGETLWRHLCLSNCRNETSWKRPRGSARPVTHPFEDPPFRGTDKTTLVGSPPETKCPLIKKFYPLDLGQGRNVWKKLLFD